MGKRILALLFFCFILPAFAGRILPPEATPGQLNANSYPLVTISGKVYHMAPGGKIYDQSNRIIMPGTLPESGKVVFLTDMNGDISKIWLLTPEEEAALAGAGK